jgi:hypothetical protein
MRGAAGRRLANGSTKSELLSFIETMRRVTTLPSPAPLSDEKRRVNDAEVDVAKDKGIRRPRAARRSRAEPPGCTVADDCLAKQAGS